MTDLAPPAAAAFPQTVSVPVRAAALAFFDAYCGPVTEEPPPCHEEPPCAGIMSAISFFGDLVWTFSLAMPEPTAIILARAFAGFDIPFDSPDMGDVLGEIANVIAGDIVARLDAEGVSAQMSLPTVIRGHDVELLTASSASTIRMGFATPTGRFWFKLVKAKSAVPGCRRPGT